MQQPPYNPYQGQPQQYNQHNMMPPTNGQFQQPYYQQQVPQTYQQPPQNTPVYGHTNQYQMPQQPIGPPPPPTSGHEMPSNVIPPPPYGNNPYQASHSQYNPSSYPPVQQMQQMSLHQTNTPSTPHYTTPTTTTTTQPPISQQPKPNLAPTQRINPNQIPSATSIYAKSLTRYYTKTNAPLPTSSNDFISIDEGNTGPRFLRMTMQNIPCSNDLLSSSGIPFGMIIQPLADPWTNEVFFPYYISIWNHNLIRRLFQW
jgi:hypothetical protein